MKNTKKIAIVTDSNSGINNDLPEGVFVVPMPCLINDEDYFEGINLSYEDFYKMLAEDATVSTSQPSIGNLSDFWTDILKEYDEIVHIPMSSGLSQACATATNLAKDFGGRVFVVDNHRVSITLKESVFDAIKLREQGKTSAEIQKYLVETSADSAIYIAVETMKYLKKCGRVTPAAAMIGSILKIKPVLQIHGEKLDRYMLARGSIKAREVLKEALKKELETQFASYTAKGEMCVSVAYTDNIQEAEKFIEEFKALMPSVPLHFTDPLPLSVSCHIGPGALGVSCSRFVK
jgi:DegV family protein with EDD domain